jgi:LuxR family maltose regulon positive regulatory protein
LNSCDTSNEYLSQENKVLLVRTKFFIPPSFPTHIIRSRLINLLNDSLNRPLILISAPAGYGKTTLVSNWVKETGINSSWLSLDAGDNDPMRFLQYLVASLLPIAPNIEGDLNGILQGMQPEKFDTVINLLTNELTSFSSSFVLVLDDFHVIQSETVLKIITNFLEHLPRQIHLVILTRTDPPLSLSRMRVRNMLLDIRADQLRFTQNEIAAFLNDTMGLTLSINDLVAMETRTEGWIAGIQLAALSMQSVKDIHGFISAFTGSHHYIMDYLVEEVLKLQPKQVSTFLLQTSILDRLNGPLCEAVVESEIAGSIDGQTMLKSLEEMNLFVIPLDNERRWYRYHHLFADVLRKRLEYQFPHLLSDLHRRASQWYEQNGFFAECIQQAIAAGDQDRAAELIEQNGCFLLISGEVATLLKWVDSINFKSETHPWLAVQKAWALAMTGDFNRIEPTLQEPEKLLAQFEPTVEVNTLLGTIAAARAFTSNSKGDIQSAAEYARQALVLLPDCSSISKSIRSVTTLILGDTSWIDGKLDEAAQAYTEAIKIGREAKNFHMVIIANSNLADILIEQGHLHRASSIFNNCLKMAIRPDGQRSALAGRLYAGLGRLAYEHNQLDEADQFIQMCIEICQQWGETEIQANSFALLARLNQIQGNPEQANEAIRHAEQLSSEHPLSTRRSIQMKSDFVFVWLAQGNLEKVSQLNRKFPLSIETENPYHREPEKVITLRILVAQNDYEAALMLSDRLLKKAEPVGQMGLVIETLILQALAYQGMKDADQALLSLERAITIAQSEGYVRSFLDEGEAMTRLLCQFQSRQIGSSYATVLLSQIDKTSGKTQPSMQILSEPLTSREVEVLKLIESGCSNQEIAGQLVISIPTVKRHISNIYSKLEVQSRTQAVAIGKELKIFE